MLRKIIAVWMSLVMLFGFVVIVDIVTDFTPTVNATTLYVNITGSGGAYTSIQDAINASNDGNTVFVYNGTYYENILVDKTINLIGENKNNTIIDCKGNGDTVGIISDWVNVSGFTIKNSSSSVGDAGIQIESNNVTIFNNHVSFNNFYGVFILSSSNIHILNNNISFNYYWGIYVESSMNNNISNNIVTFNGHDGIRIEMSSNNSFLHNNLSFNSGNGIYISSLSSNNLVNDNDIIMNSWEGVGISYSSGNLISNNYVLSRGTGIELYLSTNIIMYNNKLINGTVNLGGDKVQHYNSHIIANNNTIDDKPISYYTNLDDIEINTTNAGQILFANCTHIKISNLQISNLRNYIQIIFSSNITIVDNNISSNLGEVIRISYSSNNNISNNLLNQNGWGIGLYSSSNNRIVNNEITSNEKGIYIWHSPNNLIINNNISFNLDNGISIYSSPNQSLISNKLISNEKGLYIRDGANNCLIQNNAFLNNEQGITLGSSSYNNITGNLISQNNVRGIYLYSSSNYNRITENNISSNGQGILIASMFNNITRNEISLNYKCGINLSSSSYKNLIYRNNFILNENQADDRTNNSNNWNSTYPYIGNFWSDYTGIDSNEDGIGDTPYVIDSDSQDNYPLMQSWVIDALPPIIDLNFPLNNTVFIPGTLIDFSISDPYLDEVFYSINGSTFHVLDFPYDLNTSGWADNNYIVKIKTYDFFGNNNDSWYNLTVDSTPPSVMLISPENNSLIGINDEIILLISDENIYKMYYSENSGPDILISDPFIVNTRDWINGENTLGVFALDQAGNFNTKWYKFMKDAHSPEIILNSPENNSIIMNNLILDFQISDENLHSVNYSLNQGSFIIFEPPYDLTTTDWSDKNYTIFIQAIDNASNSIQKVFLFIKDTTPPEIILISPSNGSIITSASTIDFDIFDANLDMVSYSINEGPFLVFGDSFDFNTTEWNDGDCRIIIKAQDIVGHVNEQWYFFKIDTTSPFIESSSIEDNSVNVAIETQIEFEFSEPMNTQSVEDSITISPNVVQSYSWANDNKTLTITFDVPFNYDTLYKISINTKAKDLNGRGFEDQFELEFTTEVEPHVDGDEFPVMYLIVISVIVMAILIVVFVKIKRKKGNKPQEGDEIGNNEVVEVFLEEP